MSQKLKLMFNIKLISMMIGGPCMACGNTLKESVRGWGLTYFCGDCYATMDHNFLNALNTFYTVISELKDANPSV